MSRENIFDVYAELEALSVQVAQNLDPHILLNSSEFDVKSIADIVSAAFPFEKTTEEAGKPTIGRGTMSEVLQAYKNADLLHVDCKLPAFIFALLLEHRANQAPLMFVWNNGTHPYLATHTSTTVSIVDFKTIGNRVRSEARMSKAMDKNGRTYADLESFELYFPIQNHPVAFIPLNDTGVKKLDKFYLAQRNEVS